MSASKSLLVVLVVVASLAVGQSISVGQAASAPVYNSQGRAPQQYDPNNGFHLQNGFESYVVGARQAAAVAPAINWLARLSEFRQLLRPAYDFFLTYGVRALIAGIQALFAVTLGMLVTTGFCNLTNLCHFNTTFLPAGQQVRDSIGQIARHVVSEENLSLAKEFVQSAIDMYPGQKKQEASSARVSDNEASK